MVTHPDPAVPYPDVAARGSFAAALLAIAEECGLSVPFTVSESQPLMHTSVASTLPHRGGLSIGAAAVDRWWSIWGTDSFQKLALIDGRTTDLAELVHAAHAWHNGWALSEIRRAAPFVHLTGRFEVPDFDPAGLAESEWQHLRTDASEIDYLRTAHQPLIEAVYAEPHLRSLYPFTSHWVLRFSATTRPYLSVVGPCIVAYSTNSYTVSRDFLGEHVLAQTTTAEEAVAAAVRHFPPNLGPVTCGTSK